MKGFRVIFRACRVNGALSIVLLSFHPFYSLKVKYSN